MDTPLENQPVEICIDDISMYFGSGDRKVAALQNVSFDVRQGEFVSLLGPSGCGKSTLLRLMADLLEPTSGQIAIGSQHPREARLRRKFGIVFQSATLFEWRTVKDNIELPMEIMGFKKSEYSKKTMHLLELVGLSKFQNHYPWQLSGGMQQRVAIARALSLDPPLLLMDEPFSALDEFTKERLQLDLLDIKRQTNKTVVFVTHSIPEAVYLSDRIVILSAHPGRVHSIIKVEREEGSFAHNRRSDKFHAMTDLVRSCFHEESDSLDEQIV
ncbi:sulfonate ABC transporter ATP-binding protein [Paenibacillus sp. BIHB 4019]|uniref:Sulfonate ABC transporter ATP-binding protein n=1 Tax=Paenibacillus sp. BIHB 4019 TaxID=1870819 RepID=A0A1B2DE06_9BACL|nr:ABC transporter ATP-binding protein [Paenibacillus sp. BIHB 4019]ANY65951.1 sulfonate ABC transporter ATP-binding protein [Paenibacillus sp. BIHB 4019]